MATLQAIYIYPIKALDGMQVQSARILPGGALEHDREYQLVNDAGETVHAKKTDRVTRLRCRYDLAAGSITIGVEGEAEGAYRTFHLEREQAGFEAWLGAFFGYAVHLERNRHMGFPDDPHLHGPTVVGRGSVRQVADWFGGWDLDRGVRRFRTNLVLDTDAPWWEDRLFGERGERVAFAIGEATFWGVKPCMRCIVPTRDPLTGEMIRTFQRDFMDRRREELPADAPLSWFERTYYFSVNTHTPATEAGKTIRVGDVLKIADRRAEERFAFYVV